MLRWCGPEDEARWEPRKIAVALGPVEAEGTFRSGREIRGGALRFLREAERHRGRARCTCTRRPGWPPGSALCDPLSIVIIFIGRSSATSPASRVREHPEGRRHAGARARGTRIQDLGSRPVQRVQPRDVPERPAQGVQVRPQRHRRGREVIRKTIVVNDPLQYKGSGSTSRATGRPGRDGQVTVARKDGTPVRLLASRRTSRFDRRIRIVRGVNYEENFQGSGPALQVVVEKPGSRPPPSARQGTPRPRPATRRFTGILLRG